MNNIDAVCRAALCKAQGSALYGSFIIKCISDTKRTLDTAAGKLPYPAFSHLLTCKIKPLSVKDSSHKATVSGYFCVDNGTLLSLKIMCHC